MSDSRREPADGLHWARFRRLMAIVGGVAVLTVAGALVLLDYEGIVLRPHFVIALALGIGVSLLLAGALMGLVFVSASSGHDDEVKRFNDSLNEQGRPKGRPWH